MTIGRLADSLKISKSGLFAHFGSKQELQLATIEAAREIFEARVTGSAGVALSGLAGLWALVEAWVGYVESGVLRGGCFFAAVSVEVDDRPGAVRDRVAELSWRWRGLLEQKAREAVERHEIDSDADPEQIAFELHAVLREANNAFQLHGRSDDFERARRAIARIIGSAGADAAQ